MPTLAQAIPALPLLDSGKVVFLAGKLMGEPKPGFDAELSPVKVRRLVLFHWMTSIGVEADLQERIYKEHAPTAFENPVLLGLNNVASLKLAIGDMRYSAILPRHGMCYDFVVDEQVEDRATETLIICDVQEALYRFNQRISHQRVKHARATSAKS